MHQTKYRLKVTYVIYSLAVLEMPLDDPAVLQECVLTLVISEIDPFSSVTNDKTSAWILPGTISNEIL
jgi:hypothetical protein